MFKTTVLKVTAIAVILSLTSEAKAQKKSDTQENNPAPANVQIDGKLLEWPEQGYTLHNDTKLSYIVSNDNLNLYLTIKTNDQEKVSKILARGLSLGINKDGKKKDQASITFPVLRAQRQQRPSKDVNQRLQERLAEAKEIRVQGLETIMDGGIGIDNEYGIRAAAKLDSSNFFTYELAVPLTYVGLSANHSQPFAINIRINGVVLPKTPAGPRSPYESMRMGGYNRTSIPPMYKTEEFWIFRTLKTSKRDL